jgi:galactokinase
MAATELFVPGRLCLFGEHSDWAGSYRSADPSLPPGRCLVAGTDQGIWATARPAEDVFAVRQLGPDGVRGSLQAYPAGPAALRRVAAGAGFDAYAAGTAAVVLKRFPGLGLHLDVYRRNLPLGKGLSSSAAVCVLTVRAYSRVHGLALSVEEEMDLAYRGELLTGSECGRMDQVCAVGRAVTDLRFDGDSMSMETVAPGAWVHLLIVDLRAGKDTRRILAALNSAFAAGDAGVRKALGQMNLSITGRAREALESGNIQRLGRLMVEAQDSFDRHLAPVCPSQLAAPALHAVLHHPAVREHAWGGKGVGSGGDGTAQLLCRGSSHRQALSRKLARDRDVRCLPLSLSM